MKMQGFPPGWADYALPDARGHFGPYGGVFVAETLRAALDELTLAYGRAREDPAFLKELAWELEHYVGRPRDRKSTRLNSSHIQKSRMPSSA